ncbi:MAG: hypothetical protein AMXMBFR84_31690 [Candidatus Hydrogenedentota bacterium]
MGVRSVSGPELRALAAVNAPTLQTPQPDVATAAKAAAAKATAKAEEEAKALHQAITAPKPEPKKISEQAGLHLSIDAATERIVVQIVNEANEVIKQIPPEEVLDVLAQTRELQGLLFDQNV